MALNLRRVAHGSADHACSVELRRKVLRHPLGLDLSAEDIDREQDEIVLIAELDGSVVGTVNLLPLADNRLKMRQVAVRADMQRTGIGQALIRESEAYGRSVGAARMELNARDTAIPFYVSCGYSPEGDPFEEVTIPHQKMAKNL